MRQCVETFAAADNGPGVSGRNIRRCRPRDGTLGGGEPLLVLVLYTTR